MLRKMRCIPRFFAWPFVCGRHSSLPFPLFPFPLSFSSWRFILLIISDRIHVYNGPAACRLEGRCRALGTRLLSGWQFFICCPVSI